MKKLAIAAVTASALVTGIVAANAADMAVKAPYAAAPAVFSWTGFYIGANVGGAWTGNNGGSDFGPLFPPFIVLPPAVAIPTVIPRQLDVLARGGRPSGGLRGGPIRYNLPIKSVRLRVG